MTQQLSKHRHISFTAHYTGYIWYQMGISHPALATAKGKTLAALVQPIESWAEKYVGGSMRTTLKQRHTMLDQHLEKLIEQHPDLQVLEIACGLSPRGWWFRQHYPSILYRELDLPDMAATKQAALQQIETDSKDVLSVDLFTDAFASAFKVFDPQRPLVIISEGLINYFEKPLLQQLIQAIASYGRNFKELHYLTDIYPEPTQNKLATIIWNSSRLLKWISRSAFSFHFKTPAEVETFFHGAGFGQVEVLQPKQFFENVDLESNQQHLGDLVWMIQATNK
ncbi:class I SAM-dependent methyltransferase [Acinetobacter beijerinckii]|uniref:class I SAM-dependent methyltransferase n=1 Tax=Acinetobacter beijerinckii TaxID=262668 RepID=UPI002405DF08|nr:class I SAM-dependent methyltransferase [Acinetobacter beijerinckii]